jgi:hypothetical protein
LAGEINSQGNYYALYCGLENSDGVTGKGEAMGGIVSLANFLMAVSGAKTLEEKAFSYGSKPCTKDPSIMAQYLFNSLCNELGKDLVVFLARLTASRTENLSFSFRGNSVPDISSDLIPSHQGFPVPLPRPACAT